jgi:MFS family permease
LLRKISGEPIQKGFFIVFILLFNTFVWFYLTLTIIDNVLSDLSVTHAQNLIIWTAYYGAIIISSIVGSFLSSKISRRNLLYFWIILGVLASSLPALLVNSTVISIGIVCGLLGVSFGLGMPSCLAYFADWTLIENRGRSGGIIFFISNLIAPLFAILFGMFNLITNSIFFTSWRAIGLITFFVSPEEKIVSETKNNASFMSILREKSFLLYFVAWLMFCLIDSFERPILEPFFGDFFYLILMIGPIIGSLSAFIAGLLSDWIGRKRVVLYGFATLGIGYGIISLAPATMISWYFYLAIDSITTGILWVTFVLILWGDLSEYGAREKYYAIGGFPYFLTYIVQLLSAPYVMLIPETSVFSIAAFFLFLAVLPLLYAPETLPEKKIELRRLRSYVEKAKEVKEKREGKV